MSIEKAHSSAANENSQVETASERLEDAIARLRAKIEDHYPELKDDICAIQKALETVEHEAVLGHAKEMFKNPHDNFRGEHLQNKD